MMAAGMLDPEMTIRRHGKHNFREISFELGLLVPELVTGVYTKSAGNTCNDRQSDEGPPGELLRPCPVGNANEPQEVKRDDDVC